MSRYDAQQLRANRFHAFKAQGNDLLANARARLQRCIDRGDVLGIEYNRRMIAKYEVLAAKPVRDVPRPPALPGATS